MNILQDTEVMKHYRSSITFCVHPLGGVIKRSLSMGSDAPVHSKSTLFNLSVLRYNLNQIIRMILWAV